MAADGNAPDWRQLPVFDSAGEQYQIDPDLLRAHTMVESGGDPTAFNQETQAAGPAQLLPATAKRLGVKDPTDWNQAIPAMARTLRENYDQLGNPALASMAYFGSPDQDKWGPKTQGYLKKVSAAYGDFGDQNPFEYKPKKQQQPLSFDDLLGGGKAAQRQLSFDDLLGSPEESGATWAKGAKNMEQMLGISPKVDELLGLGGREAAQSAVSGTGSTAKGLAEMNKSREMLRPYWDLYQRFDQMSPEEQRKAEIQIDRDAMTKKIPEGIGIYLTAQLQEAKEGRKVATFDEFAGAPPSETGLYKAGEAASKFGQQQFPVTEQERKEHPIVSGIGQTVGGTIPAIAATAAGSLVGQPELGLAAGAGQMGAMMASEQAERARQQRPYGPLTPEEQAEAEKRETGAAQSGFVGGAAMGALPLGAILRPVERTAPGLMPWAAAKLQQAAQGGITFAGIGEAQTWLGEQIARQYGDDKAGYSFDLNRVVSGLIGGGLLAAAHPAGAPPEREAEAAPATAGAGETRQAPPPSPPQGGVPSLPAPRSAMPEARTVEDLVRDVQAPPPDAGTRAKPVKVETADDLGTAERHVDPQPTEAQIEAGNYQKGHVRFQGLDGTIESAAGDVRRGTGPDGKPWEVQMPVAYGYLKGTRGRDGDQVDAFFGNHPDAKTAFVVDQIKLPGGKFDEHKLLLGFPSEAAAVDAYQRSFSDGKGQDRIGAVTAMTPPELKDWLGKPGARMRPAGKIEPRVAPPPTDAASPQAVIRDIDAGHVTPNPDAIAARWGIEPIQAARLMHDVYQRPDSPIQPASAPSEDPATWTWRRVSDDRREARVRDVADYAHTEFGIGREQHPDDVAFIDATMAAQQQAIMQRLQPIKDRASKHGLTLTDDEASDVELAIEHGHDPDEAIHDAAERGGIRTEQDLAGEAQKGEGIPDEWKTPLEPVAELAPPTVDEPPRPRAAPAGPEPGAEERGVARGAEPTGGPQEARTQEVAHTGEQERRVAELEAERAAEARGEKVAGAPARSFEQIAKHPVGFDDLLPKTEEKPAGYGAGNKFFTQDAAAKARERLRAKMGRLSAGFDPEMMLDGLTLAGYHIEAGARKFSDYSKAMLGDLGESIKPYLKHLYQSVRGYPGFDAHGMDEDAAIDRHLNGEPQRTPRMLDDNGNPVFTKGERVVIPEGGGHLVGRHGEVTAAHAMTMAPMFGHGERQTSFHYEVKTDEGALSHSSKLEPETARPPRVVPDPMVDGVAVHPRDLESRIGYAVKDAKNLTERAGRARKGEMKQALMDGAANETRNAQKLRAVIENWRRQYPEESARLFPVAKSGATVAPEPPKPAPPEVPRPPQARAEVRQNAEKGGVEIKFSARPDEATIGRLKAAGFRWSSPQKLWYAKQTSDRLALANEFAGAEPVQRDLPKPAQASRPLAHLTDDELAEMARRHGVDVSGLPPSEATPAGAVPFRRKGTEDRVTEAMARTPTAHIEQQAAQQGGRAEIDHAEGQSAAAPVTTAASPFPDAVPEDQRWKPGDRVMLKYPSGLLGPARAREVVSVSPDGRQITLDGGLLEPHEGLERAPEGPKSEAETRDELHGNLPPGDAAAGTGDVQRAGARGQAGDVRAPEERRGTPAPERATGAGAEGRGRPAEGSAGTEARGREGDGRNAGLPGAGAGPASGAARRLAAAKVTGKNLSLAAGEVEEGRGPSQKAKDNVAAIELAKRILAEDRPATREEQTALAKYVGWGGLSGAFPDSNARFRPGLEEVGKRLKTLLTPQEYETARKSTQYAHYTSEPVIRAMWDAVRAMGFDGGNVFEPGMGVGHFIGMMPPDLALRTRYEGLELDHQTARLAKLIYPESGVRQADYTRTPMPENAFDLVIGNPPFSDAVVHADPKYTARNFMLHDYFFAKSLDSVRPGGLMAFITSAGTMNKIDPAARRYLSERADLVGGVRLPNNAFRQNAGTDVTTDILFFKKRPEPVSFEGPGAEKVPDWTETTPRSLPGRQGTPIAGNVSRYFSEHPEQVIGRETFADTLYGQEGRYAVQPIEGQALAPALAEALGRLPRDVMEKPLTGEERAVRDLEAPERKDGSYYLRNGDLWQYRQGAGQAVARRGSGVAGLTAADHERIKRLIPIRDALRDVFRGDLTGDVETSARAREALNQRYDAFVQKHGPLNKAEFRRQRPSIIAQENARQEAREEARAADLPWREGEFNSDALERGGAKIQEIARARADQRQDAEAKGREFDEGSFEPDEMPDVVIEKRPNIDAFMDDPESYRLRAIEHYDDGSGESRKKRIFFENIISKEEEPQLASANDGVLWSLNKHGRLDLDAIAAQMGKSRDEVVEELGDKVFRVPGTEDAYQTADEYLSGDVMDKLAEAKAIAGVDPTYQRNVDALQRAQPKPLAPSEITMTLGMPWIPPDTIRAFARDHARIGDVEPSHNKIIGGWVAEGKTQGAAFNQWGTPELSAFEVLRAALNRAAPRIYKEIRTPEGKVREFDPVATQGARDKIDQMKQAFRDYVEQTPELKDRLAQIYNDKFNRTVLRPFDGSYLTTPGVSSEWKWRPHQQRAIARIVQTGNTYVAHEVGAGKTSVYIGAGMEMRRLGLIKKPGFIVPNHMLAQFAKEFYEQYPLAKVMVADERGFHTSTRKQFMANVAQNDIDGVVMTHSAFGMIPISDEFQEHLIREQLEQVAQAMGALNEKDDRITVKRLEKQKERLEQRLQGAFKGKKDQTNTFEEMGVDHLFIDEAHMMRKLEFATRQSRLKGITPDGSNMAWDLYSKIQYLESRRPGRSAVLGSGTPVTNTMGELYTISRYLQRPELERRGLGHFDSWANTFGDLKTAMEQTAEGAYQHVTRFAKFVNIPELYKMVGQIMDVVTGHDLDQYVVRPRLKGGERSFHLAPKTPELEAYQGELASRVAAIKARKGPPQKGDDILLAVIGDGRHAAIDMRYVDPQLPSSPDSKLNQMIDNVHRTWAETHDVQFYDPASNYQKPAFRGPATQMVFMNFGTGDSERRLFSGYDWVKRELVRRGVPKDQIAFIKDYKSHVAKQKLFNDMNEGRVRILVGSVQKMGTGVNAQRRLYAIHNEDPLWYPADDTQRNGRGLRQGNFNPEIEIHDYSTKGTYDSTMWQLMGNKGRFIEQFFRGDPNLRDIEDLGEASQYEQASAISTADERIIHLTEMKHQLDRLELRKQGHDREQYQAKHDLEYARREAVGYDQFAKAIEGDIAKRRSTAGDEFTMQVGDSTFDKRKAAAAALDAEVMRAASRLEGYGDTTTLGALGGFPIVLEKRAGWRPNEKVIYSLNLERSDGSLMPMESGGAGAMGAIQSGESRLRNLEGALANARRQGDDYRRQAKSLEAMVGKKFEHGDEIKDLRQKVDDLEFDINLSTKAREIESAIPSDVRAAGKANAEVPFEKALEHYVDGLDTKLIPGLRDANTRIFGAQANTRSLNHLYDMVTGRRKAPEAPTATEAAPPRVSLAQRGYGLEPLISSAGVEKASPEAWRGFIRQSKGVSADDVTRSGVHQWLDRQTGPVTKQALLDHIRQENVGRPVTDQQRDQVTKAVNEVLDRMAPGAKRIREQGLISVDGQKGTAHYQRDGLEHTIRWSLASPDAVGSARHEAIHYLRHSGLLTEPEWATLEKAAEDQGWIDRHGVSKQYGDVPYETQLEEAVAKEFAKWRRDQGPEPTRIRQVFDKIGRFLNAAGAAVRRLLGRQATADDIFGSIERGEVGARPRQVEPQGALARDQREIPGTEAETPEQVAARLRQRQKEEAEAAMRGRKGPKKPQEDVGETPLFGGPRQGGLFELAPGDMEPADPEEPEPTTIAGRIMAKLPGPVRLAEAANSALDYARSLTKAFSPMAMPAGRFEPTERGIHYEQSKWIQDARATAFDFASKQRASAHEWGAIDRWTERNFKPQQRERMYDALDEMSVAAQQGKPLAGIGVDRLTPEERDATMRLYEKVKARFDLARQVGVHDMEGLPWYAPRMLVNVGEPDAKVVRDIRTLALAGQNLDKAIIGKVLIKQIEKLGDAAGVKTVSYGADAWGGARGPSGLDRLGSNITTTSAQLRHRKYLTREETEEAASHVKVSTERRGFTIPGHPAFERTRLRFETSEETGSQNKPAVMPVRSAETGQMQFLREPIYVHPDFEGPLRAIMSSETSKVVQGLMRFKGRTMTAIMWSPMTHNMVIAGRALPAVNGNPVALIGDYSRGAAITGRPLFGAETEPSPKMQEMIRDGVDPIGHRYELQQGITGIAEAPTIAPGRSLTAKAIGLVPGLFDRRAGDATKRAIDATGDLMHNRLLWDRVGALQAGLWDRLKGNLIQRGFDPDTAGIYAGHFANRYAGAMPMESMSRFARALSGLLLFSRSYTLGTLGTFKDALVGLPLDRQAKIMQLAGSDELARVQGVARRKAMSIIAIDAALFYAGISATQSALAVMSAAPSWSDLPDEIGKELHGYARRLAAEYSWVKDNPVRVLALPFLVKDLTAQSENEPGKDDRIKVGEVDPEHGDHTAIYMRNPVGKTGEELVGWLTKPLQMIRNKLSPMARPFYEMLSNNQGFDQKLYDSHEGALKSMGRIGWEMVKEQGPADAVKAAWDYLHGNMDPHSAKLQLAGSATGFTFSHGYPGGPAEGVAHAALERYKFMLSKEAPDIRRMIKAGNMDAADAQMQKLGIAAEDQRWLKMSTLYPKAILTGRQARLFEEIATPEEKQAYERAVEGLHE